MQITSVLFLEAIEPALAFWVDRLGFEKIAEVPHGDVPGFVILRSGEAELMLQSWASVADDAPDQEGFARASRASLFVQVSDFPDIVKKLGDWPVCMPVRDTFYGMREVGVVAPGGHLVVFAAPVPGAEPGVTE